MISVAIIVRPAAPDPTIATQALAAAGAPPPIVVRADPALGLGMARNEALRRCATDVLALVEDDVAVSPGWWAALHDAWSSPEAGEAGFAGGPILARVTGDRPAWLTEDLLAAFALDDRTGDDARTFHGGNVSFRTAALRAGGGFWPARGATGDAVARDWFSDEHLAQRALLDAGWSGRFVPGATVERLIDPAAVSKLDLLRRRARYGAREQLLAGRAGSTSQALAAVGRSAAGTLDAAARRRTDLVVERAARAAQGVGALLGDRLVHDELQPVVTRTPFRDSVPAPAPRPRRLASVPGRATRRPAATGHVLLYHRVAAVAHDPLGLAVHPDRFAAQMAWLADRHAVVPLERAGAPGTVAVTFDDGYADNLHAALPVLTAHGIPATLFASTGHIAHGTAFWWDELVRLLDTAPAGAGPLRVAHPTGTRVWPAHDAPTRTVARAQLHAWLQAQLPEAIERAMREIRVWAGQPADPAPPPAADRPMTLDELRAFADAPGMTIGAHARTHPSLAFAPGPRQEDEIAGSRDDLRSWLGAAPTAFSYPFGIPGCDVDQAVQDRVRAAGFTHATINAPVSPAPGDLLAIARSVVPDDDGPAFARLLGPA